MSVAEGRRVTVSTAAGDLTVADAVEAVAVGQSVAVAWRPEKTRIVRAEEAISNGRAVIPGTVHDIGYLGDWTTYHVAAGGLRLKAAVANASRIVERPISWGDAVKLAVAPDALILLVR